MFFENEWYNLGEKGDDLKKRTKKMIPMSTFICCHCEKVAYELPRNCSQREKGHIKDLFCPWCHRINKCREIRASDAYKTLSGEIIGQEKSNG